MEKQLITQYEQLKRSIKEGKNRLLIDIGWDVSMVIPYEDGLKMLAALEKAELYANKHDLEKIKIIPMEHSKVVTSMLAESTYTNIKVAALMGITYKELQNELNTRPTGSSE